MGECTHDEYYKCLYFKCDTCGQEGDEVDEGFGYERGDGFRDCDKCDGSLVIERITWRCSACKKDIG